MTFIPYFSCSSKLIISSLPLKAFQSRHMLVKDAIHGPGMALKGSVNHFTMEMIAVRKTIAMPSQARLD